MPLARKIYFAIMVFVGFAGLMLFLVKMADATMQVTAGAPEIDAASKPGVPSLSMNLISLTAVVSGDRTVGSLAIYDDPRTARPEDYIELYDNSGQLVAVGWIDRFGIQRITVDRSLLENRDDLRGVFVTVVDGVAI
jgi:hypothetical protein